MILMGGARPEAVGGTRMREKEIKPAARMLACASRTLAHLRACARPWRTKTRGLSLRGQANQQLTNRPLPATTQRHTPERCHMWIVDRLLAMDVPRVSAS